MADAPAFEYTQAACDVWQIAHLCNHMAGHGWDFLAMVETHAGVQLPEGVGDWDGPRALGRPLRPYEVLFRRPFVPESKEED